MNSNDFDFKFWEMDYRKRFQINREGEEILHYLIVSNPENAKKFIQDKYSREVDRLAIIDSYCDKYDNRKINKLLNNLEFESLTQEEIKEYEIRRINKPKCALIGEDGNIFNLMGIASRTLRRNGMAEEATEMCNRITSGAKSYEDALLILQDYVEITSKEQIEDVEYEE